MPKENKVIKMSKKVMTWIKPYARAEIVGSIRRRAENPGDVDVVLIPKNQKAREKLEALLESKGKQTINGEGRAFFEIEGVGVNLFYTVPEEWGATLLAYSSVKGSSIGLKIVARDKGFKLSQHGLFSLKTGKRVAGKTEREIYKALGRPYKEPWNR